MVLMMQLRFQPLISIKTWEPLLCGCILRVCQVFNTFSGTPLARGAAESSYMPTKEAFAWGLVILTIDIQISRIWSLGDGTILLLLGMGPTMLYMLTAV